MPLFISDSELEGLGANVAAVASKADEFIRELQEQLEAEKGACVDVQQKLVTVLIAFSWLLFGCGLYPIQRMDRLCAE